MRKEGLYVALKIRNKRPLYCDHLLQLGRKHKTRWELCPSVSPSNQI